MTTKPESVEQLAERIVSQYVGGAHLPGCTNEAARDIREWLKSHGIDSATMKPISSLRNEPTPCATPPVQDAELPAQPTPDHRARAVVPHPMSEPLRELREQSRLTGVSNFYFVADRTSPESKEKLHYSADRLKLNKDFPWNTIHDAIARANGLQTLAEIEEGEKVGFPTKFADDVLKISTTPPPGDREWAIALVTALYNFHSILSYPPMERHVQIVSQRIAKLRTAERAELALANRRGEELCGLLAEKKTEITDLQAQLAATEAKLQREREDAGKLCYRHDQLEQRIAALKEAEGRMGGRGVLAIAKERKRQRDSEGWTEQHDDSHAHGEMALAAALYATPKNLYEKLERANGTHFVDPWPWDRGWDKRKRHSEVKRLAIAGALIAAEIDRLHRITEPQPTNAE